MANITSDSKGNFYDLDTNIGRYQYLASRLDKYGAGSDEFSLLERLYKEAECSPEIVQAELAKRARVAKFSEEDQKAIKILWDKIDICTKEIKKIHEKAYKEQRCMDEDEEWYMGIELCKRADYERIIRNIIGV